jgi:hypothetical protein
MKTFNLFFVVIIFSLLFSSCMGTIQFRVMKPADIDVPQSIQYLATANRYKPDKPSRAWNVIEGILSGEGIGMDRRSAEVCLEGLNAVLNESPRYKYAQLAVDLPGTGTANFPEPLQASEIDRLCQMSKADALVTIEAFDSDSKADFSTYTRKVTQNNESRDVTYHRVESNVRVTVGWRMYRAKDGVILDQYRMNENLVFKGEGTSRNDAVSKLPSKENMVREVGRRLGNLYASRISPAWFWVSRNYFTQAPKTPEMKLAKRAVRVNNWEEAARIWKSVLSKNDSKSASRAMFNLALASEYSGDLKSATDWSEQAYKNGLQRALEYNGILRQRLFDEERLKNQLSKPE